MAMSREKQNKTHKELAAISTQPELQPPDLRLSNALLAHAQTAGENYY